jgi:hypothetical protein
MIAVSAGVRIVVAARPVDFRNGLDGLAAKRAAKISRKIVAGQK